MTEPVLIRCEDPDVLAARAAAMVVECAHEAVRERGKFTLVLAGGSTPAKTYRMLAEPEHAAAIEWSKTFIFFGDERLVPPDDPRSNFGVARHTLLAWVPVPAGQVFPVPTQWHTAEEAAAAYAGQIGGLFTAGEHAHDQPSVGARRGHGTQPPPRFDLILLGLGDDGHTASLFPGAAALRVEDAWVTWSPPGGLPPFVDRVTLTYPVLNAARHVVFLVAGAKKAAALRDVIEGQAPRDVRPAAGVRPVDGTLTWIVDEEAASLLSRDCVSCG